MSSVRMQDLTPGYLLLEDGTVFRGRSVGAPGAAFGEAVFTTAMTGYQETVTDPSYAEQLVCFTAPMVGNYGVAEERGESGAPHAKAALMRAARGQRVGRVAHGARSGRARGDRHARARPPAARRGRHAGRGRRRRGRAARSRRARPRPRAAGDGGPVARRLRVHARAVRVHGDRLRAGRGRRLRHETVDPAPPRRRRRRGDGTSALGHARASSRSTTGWCSRTARATPSRCTTRWRPSEGCSAASPSSESASAISCSASRPATARSSCPSATAARTTRCWSGARAACS